MVGKLPAFCLGVLVLLRFFHDAVSIKSLSAFVDKFEYLDYDAKSVGENHIRLRRSLADENSWLHIRFRSHGRPFHLRLKPDSSVFPDDHSMDFNGRRLKTKGPGSANYWPNYEEDTEDVHDLSFLYHGNVAGDPHSYAYGSVLDGIFDGHVQTGDGKLYHVEKVSKHLGRYHKEPYHSVIYEDEAIAHDRVRQRKRRAVYDGKSTNSDDGKWDDFPSNARENHPGCPLEGTLKRKMEEMQNSAINPDFGLTIEDDVVETKRRYHPDFQDQFPWDRDSGNSFDSKRTKRQSLTKQNIAGASIWTVRTCSLYMQADHLLYNHIFNNEGGRDPTRTREEILSLFNSHVKAVNHIYGDTSFGGITGVNFIVQRTSIYDASLCSEAPSDSGNPFCNENVDVSNYLNMNSKKNHSAFCLAYAMTYRDFVGGTLGLAWVASPQPSTAGGICEIYKEYSEKKGRVWRSLNTGIITVVNYGNRVPPRVSQLTLAHEIGHNFGSPHDYPQYCQPGLPEGNYIMFASATSGDKRNNAKFSECSVKNISQVLISVLGETPVDPQRILRSPSGGKRNCFSERTTEFCGNQIKEPNEQCDCGFTQADCDRMNDRCCYPHKAGDGSTQKGCTHRSASALTAVHVQCSPSEGTCCNPSTCSYRGIIDKCSDAGECTMSQKCSGRMASCPPPPPKPDSTLCQENTKVCRSGSCNSSICTLAGLKECFIAEGTSEDKCQLACQKNGKCVSSFLLPELKQYYQAETGRKGILLRPGSPCDNYQGYCDIFRKCRSVDSNGPLSRLKNLLFNSRTFETVSEWIQEHWWAVVLIGIGLVLFMALFIKCCAVHTPSTNPRKAPAHSIYETLRHPTTLVRNNHSRGHGGDRDRHHRHHHHGRHRSRSHQRTSRGFDDPSTMQAVNGAQLGPPPIPQGPPPMPPAGPSAGMTPVEQPPPYSAAVRRDPAVYGAGGPARGHRKNKKNSTGVRPDATEMKNRRT